MISLCRSVGRERMQSISVSSAGLHKADQSRCEPPDRCGGCAQRRCSSFAGCPLRSWTMGSIDLPRRLMTRVLCRAAKASHSPPRRCRATTCPLLCSHTLPQTMSPLLASPRLSSSSCSGCRGCSCRMRQNPSCAGGLPAGNNGRGAQQPLQVLKGYAGGGQGADGVLVPRDWPCHLPQPAAALHICVGDARHPRGLRLSACSAAQTCVTARWMLRMRAACPVRWRLFPRNAHFHLD